MNYNIFIWPTTYQCFYDLALLIKSTIDDCEGHCTLGDINADRINILLGANACCRHKIEDEIPDNSVIVNFEQLYDQSFWITKEYLDLMKNYQLWDYNKSNQKWLKERLGKEVPLIRLGYASHQELIDQSVEKDIDVLFYGGKSDRRSYIESVLRERLPDKKIVFRYNDLWDLEKLDLISRSKIVLNIHYYCTCLFEYPRVLQLLSNSKFVISEYSNDMSEYLFISKGLVCCPYTSLVNKVVYYLEHLDEAEQIAATGYQIVNKLPTILPEFVDPPVPKGPNDDLNLRREKYYKID